METLIAEDLALLLLDDDKGTMAASSVARPLFGGALLVELALSGAVEVAEKTGVWSSAKVRATGTAAPSDPLLAAALATVAKQPRSAQDLTNRIGKGVREQLLERLVDRGLLERREGRFLGLFPHTTWPAADAAHERAVRQRLQDVLVTGVDPDPRTAGLVALLAAVDQAHKVVDPDRLKARQVKRRAKDVAEGAWAADAVRDAVQAAQAAVTAAVVASTAATTAGGS
ncbi:GOLPH3/VPS74 family protein [Nocardioides euryhalodurans]|uniref:GPP34 family phosphoprotein n=1 Tax=Nocardioides euryhalodurans TaxID=2518370 RepID=A0A4P7GQ18_9ACTN|nr:GPP34 family phosphoprotein [Nocardioides euryhalodurans]QBR93917.1 GPP34 family phosphoprotein [Nocardioides euryhalodurans]